MNTASTQQTETIAHRLTVQAPDGTYDVLVGRGLLTDLGPKLVALGLTGPAALVTDEAVAPLHASTAAESLAGAGLPSTLVVLPPGEAAKTLDTVRLAYDAFLAAGLGRDATVVALGGGVIGDLVGFAAATYLRGVAFVQAPTTLLSMVDASVGGKVGVDLPQGKNLVGAFKTPRLVLADLATLDTLPLAEVTAGLAEVVKAGIIDDPELLVHLETEGPEPLAWSVTRAIAVKQRVVEEDPYERGRRAVLNLGHTFGHSLESLSGFRLRHGECVAIGMVAAAHLAARLGYAAPALEARIRSVLVKLGLPTGAPGYAPADIYAGMFVDKKKAGGKLRFIVPRDVGDVIVVGDVPVDDVMAAIEVMTG
ncbi:MAG: 3-dehydroquinate synthase [Anaerolineae bacterium]